MDISVPELPPDLGAKDHDLFLRPSKGPGEESQGQALEPLVIVLEGPGTNLLEALVAGPSVERPLVVLFDDVLEAGLLHYRPVCHRHVDRAAERSAGILEQSPQAGNGGPRFQCTVVATIRKNNVLHFKPTTGFQGTLHRVEGNVSGDKQMMRPPDGTMGTYL